MTTGDRKSTAPISGRLGGGRGSRAAILVTTFLFLGWTIIVSLYLRARSLLGHWPQKNIDDPKSLALGLHYAIAGYSVLLCAVATLAAFVLFGVLAARGQKEGRVGMVLALLAGALSLLLFFLTPWVSWYLD